MKWTHKNIPDQSGKVAIVTGANTGVGFEAARQLALRGAEVTLACRSKSKGEEAVKRILAENPSGSASLAVLDLADLESVSAFVRQFSESHAQLDLLINNAGVMIPPKGAKTRQGFEMQFGVNHLGHFALTGQLIGLLLKSPAARVVNLSSGAHHHESKKDFDDINFEKRGYKPWRAYCQSKLANLLFTNELQDRLTEANASAIAVAAHPGFTRTDLQRGNIIPRILSVLAMRPEQGALPTLRAATATDVLGGDYYGPEKVHEMRGYPVRVDMSEAAQIKGDAVRLWEISEELTKVTYEVFASAENVVQNHR